jgi:hypothetical protein
MEDLIMKKALLFLLTIGFCFAGIANPPADSWVVSKEGKLNCKQIRVGSFKARILLQDGNKIVLPIDQINSYSLDGTVYNKLTLYIDGKPTSRMVFMELMKTCNGASLYKYYRYDAETPQYCYYIYKGNQFFHALDDSMDSKRIADIFRYFGFKAVFA